MKNVCIYLAIKIYTRKNLRPLDPRGDNEPPFEPELSNVLMKINLLHVLYNFN